MDHAQQQQAIPLTPELWAEVFVRVEAADTGFREYTADDEYQEQQQKVHQLKLVCKQFNEVFKAYPQTLQRLYISPGFASSSLPSLIKWVQRHKTTLTVFEAHCGSLVDAILGALISPASCLRLVDLTVDKNSYSLDLLPCFGCLEMCAISAATSGQVDLSPLQALPKLHHLVLVGGEFIVKKLSHVEALHCHNVVVSCAEDWTVTQLHSLELVDSTLQGLHRQGLVACTALKSLVWKSSSWEGHDGIVHFKLDGTVDHANSALLPSLQQLTRLDLEVGIHTEEPISPNWVFGLTSLKDLTISFRKAHFDLIQSVSLLTSLTKLAIGSVVHSPNLPILDVDLHWYKLQLLQQVSIDNCTLSVGLGTGALIHLPCLSSVSFVNSLPEGKASLECFAALMDNFAKLRPQLQVMLATSSASDYFAMH